MCQQIARSVIDDEKLSAFHIWRPVLGVQEADDTFKDAGLIAVCEGGKEEPDASEVLVILVVTRLLGRAHALEKEVWCLLVRLDGFTEADGLMPRPSNEMSADNCHLLLELVRC